MLRRVNLLLLALAVVLALVLTVGLLALRQSDPAPVDGRARELSRLQEEVTAAAEQQTVAFLTVDHRDMDRLVQQVLDGATGSFERQYAASAGRLKASTRKSRAVSTGEVLQVGVEEIDADNAVVLVAADSEVTNTSTRGKPQPRRYRIELTLQREDGRWLTSGLRFVG